LYFGSQQGFVVLSNGTVDVGDDDDGNWFLKNKTTRMAENILVGGE